MTDFHPTASGKLTAAVRILLGIVFVYSSVEKIANPSAFAAVLINYQLLPSAMIGITAVVFPWVEAFCGLALVLGRLDRGAALLVCLMMVTFIGVTGYNGYRGLNIACGCFSLSAREPSNIVLLILRDLAILIAGVWVFLRPSRRNAGMVPR